MMLPWPLLHALLLAQGAGEAAPPPPVEPRAEPWSLAFELYTYHPPAQDAYALPILNADRGALHLEARYNYEDLDAGSVFVGRSFSFGEELALDLTPMLGLVAGSVTGVAPALELDLTWRGLELYVETEYVIDLADEDDDFLYTWSELTLAPLDWLRFGLVGQRTRVFDQELWIDRGFLVGFELAPVSLDLYLFNPDQDEPYLSLGLGVAF